jgi:hypothetical protein
MFTAALLIIAQTRNNPKCPKGEWLKKLWNIYTTEYYSTIKRNGQLIHAISLIDLKGIMHSEKVNFKRFYII